ncbi:MATE family efflux transporter [Nocardioides flavus (ex Wang et al. 2016)]|uniref:MATE family efflux transporter n=1 Tax=Nocardioides flavus (ex Wang et al. 2016) TaxID=2058780 RepID=UPI00174E3145|nr:MATE family efflux transporter [Nocardioides flavus (ex Wang et al. 2016)]
MTADREREQETDRETDREILRLAVPAFLALVAEPLFLLSDAAIVGHLGTPELAGLGVAAVVLQTVVGLCVFLAYGTTASVARHLGAGDLRAALAQGVDGVWLAVLIGTLATALGIVLTPTLVGIFGTGEEAAGHAETYLSIAFLGTTPLLVMLAATGVLRGLQDTRTPLAVAVVGNGLNIVFNVVLVYGLDLGIAGAAIGSVLAQVISAAWLLVVVVRAARAHDAPLSPDRAGIAAAAHAAVALVVRTLALRACLLVGTYAVTRVGTGTTDVNVATHQVAITLWTFLAFALDAIAIAAQALTGRALGSGDVDGTRRLTRRMVRWGWGSGIVAGIALAAVAPFVGALFTPDPEVRALLVPVLLVAALGQPLAGMVFVLDGVLIGAGDGAYLAWAGLVVLAAYAPAALWAASLPHGLVAVWVAMTFVFMGARGVLLSWRARGEAWLVTGATSAR